MISIIVAVANNMAIGRDNKLLWHISEDLKYFKKVTLGHPVIMGRKTWESIGKALPNRKNIVVSRSLKDGDLEGAQIYASLKSAIDSCSASEEVFIIGGGEIYRESLAYADKLYVTHVNIAIDNADTFFPEIDKAKWREISRDSYSGGENFNHPFDFVIYELNR